MNCYSGQPKKSGTTKDKRDNRVTTHKPTEKAKVSCLHKREDAADVEDATDVEQNAEKKITKKKWRYVTRFFNGGVRCYSCQRHGHY